MISVQERQVERVRELTGDLPLYLLVAGKDLDKQAARYSLTRVEGEPDYALRLRISGARLVETVIVELTSWRLDRRGRG